MHKEILSGYLNGVVYENGPLVIQLGAQPQGHDFGSSQVHEVKGIQNGL